MTKHISRRNFLKHSGALGAITSVGMPLVMNLLPTDATAAVSGPYKALVCVFLAGGNDAYNTVVRNDSVAGVARYLSARPDIALPEATVNNSLYALDLTGRNHTTAAKLMLHPNMPKMRERFGRGEVALIGNVGPLVDGTIKPSEFDPGSVRVPPKLFSHNDQQSVWQSGKPDGATSGWGGEMVRRFTALNTITTAANGGSAPPPNLFSSLAVEASAVFSAGTNFKAVNEPAGAAVSPLGVASTGVLQPGNSVLVGAHTRESLLFPIFNGTNGMSTLTAASGTTKHLIETDYQGKLSSANTAWQLMTDAQTASGFTASAPPTDNQLAKQLQAVVNVIKARDKGQLSYGRQVFFVQLSGFDTHSGQTRGGAHDNLLAQLDAALDYFYTQLGTDVANVTTFTASDFGRKLKANGDGSDHGWGGHHFVMGGGVKGGAYGHFPDLSQWDGKSVNDAERLLSDGTMVPAVAVETYAKELGQWFGLNWSDGGANAELAKALFPNAGTYLNFLV
jgi:uncharacterized protein (DUF1501 family)